MLAPIASGGMAEVWLARRLGEAGFSRDVVIKRMHPRMAHDAHFVRMFLDEARLTAALQHPNIAQVLDLGRADDHWFIAMEFVDGPDLGRAAKSAVRSQEGVPIPLAAWIVARAAQGLHYAHQQRDPMTGRPLDLIHRDVSHANLLLSRHGDVKVIDFGIARANVRKSTTNSGIVKGKPGYLAPEQLKGHPQDARVDVFALGVVLWELLTGRVLFRRTEHVVSMERTLDFHPPPPSSLRPTVSPDLDAVVLAALEKEPGDRVASAGELARCLDACLAGDPSGLASRAGLSRWVERSPAWPPATLRAILARRRGLGEDTSLAHHDGDRTDSPVPPPIPATRAVAPEHGGADGQSHGPSPRGGGTLRRVLPELGSKTVRASRLPSVRAAWEEPTPIRRDNLVHNRDRFIGRAPLLKALKASLAAGDRLVTLTGPPGVGKSRLADAFARRQAPHFANAGGTWRCSLSACRSLEDACRVVAEAIDLPLGNASTTSVAVTQIGAALAGRGATLLWLDDAGVLREQVATAVANWLAASASLVVVATARRALRVTGERVVVVPPLSLDGGADSEAAQLLSARASKAAREAVAASPERVTAIVAQLDGSPLAIELAAARLGEVDTAGLLREMAPEDPLQKPMIGLGGAMRVTWSQLRSWELAALLQLSVLPGGVDAESAAALLVPAAESAVSGPNGDTATSSPPLMAETLLAGLHERSLLRPVPAPDGTAPRLTMHDSVRAWLQGAGQPAEASALLVAARARRDAWGLRLAERCAAAARSHDGARARARLGVELDNFLLLHADALKGGSPADIVRALRVSVALQPLLLDRGPLVVASRLLDDSITIADAMLTSSASSRPSAPALHLGAVAFGPVRLALAAALADRAEVRVRSGMPTDGLADAERALALATAAGDDRLQATSQLRLSNCHRRLDHATRAMRAAVQARLLGQKLTDLPIETEAMHLFGCVYYDLGDRAPARRCFETSLRGAQQLGDRNLAARARANLGCIQADLAELDEAESSFAHALADERALGNLRGMAVDTCYLALVAQERGEHERADNLFQRAVTRLDEVGDTFRKAYVAGFRAWNALERGDLDTAEEDLSLTVAFFVDKGDRKLRAMHLATLGVAQRLRGDAVAAVDTLARAEHVAQAGSDPVTLMVVSLLRAASDVAAVHGLPVAEVEVATALMDLREAEARADRPSEGPYGQARSPLADVSSEVRFALRVAQMCKSST